VNSRSTDTSVIFKGLTKVNIRPIGENSPDLVTLIGGPTFHFHVFRFLAFFLVLKVDLRPSGKK
jgi:hypothetical protein